MNIGVIIAAFNAGETIGTVISRVAKHIHIENIIVVDDGSSDTTASVAASMGARVLNHPVNRGKGAALQTGFDFVLQTSLDAVITLDADLQHPPDFIPQFTGLYSSGKYDIIIGNRQRRSSSSRQPRTDFTSALFQSKQSMPGRRAT